MKKYAKGYSWKFQRIGGLDQVILTTSQDIARLPDLDPKLWVALSCPITSLEFNESLLLLLDKDGDKRIRLQDISGAIDWLGLRLRELSTLKAESAELPLSAINTATLQGKKIIQTARSILINVNKKNAQAISEADLIKSGQLTENSPFNGDGVLPVLTQFGSDVNLFIKDALNIIGGVTDLSGAAGITAEIARSFITSLQQWHNWRKSLGAVNTAFKENTSEIWQLVHNLKEKIDDYFLRTQLADYAPQAESELNVTGKCIAPEENGLLDNKTLANLPLSRIESDKPLDLKSGLNPVWRDQVICFAALVKKYLSHPNKLTFNDWNHIQKLIQPYSEATLSKPKIIAVAVTIKPTLTIDALGQKRVDTLLNSDTGDQVIALAEKDATTPAVAEDVADLRQLILYHHYLYRLLLNFVSFHDFFDLKRIAIFQSGRLYIDGRCCTLCLPVDNISSHIQLANYSELFLLYCQCMRKNPTGDTTQDKTLIVAALTAGNANFIVNGRNGIYVDNNGIIWDATIVNIIIKPISISQAVWSPYKQLGHLITTQFNKWAFSKQTTVSTKIQTTSTAAVTGQPFDISKNVGILAAIGLALGAIGTAIATILHSLLALKPWQWPLVCVALFLFISGPSVVLAWLKLRRRTLGPLLEASGWAINGKILINFKAGAQLTSKATLQKNAHLVLFDPKNRRRVLVSLVFWIAIVIGVLFSSTLIWKKNTFHLQSQIRTKLNLLYQKTS